MDSKRAYPRVIHVDGKPTREDVQTIRKIMDERRRASSGGGRVALGTDRREG